MRQVLNGLLSRSDQKEAISIPIGVIPAGSDNSLVWTVLGVRDPISAAMAIVKVFLPSHWSEYHSSFIVISSFLNARSSLWDLYCCHLLIN